VTNVNKEDFMQLAQVEQILGGKKILGHKLENKMDLV
jgi:hypothetical protein